MLTLPSDPPTTIDSDKEPIRWTFDDNQEAEKSGWGMIKLKDRYVPYVGRTVVTIRPTGLSGLIQKEPPPNSGFANVLIVIKSRAADGCYVASKALVILSAQKLCGQ